MNAKLSYRLAVSVLLLGALTASPAGAGEGRWTPAGPGGGIVYSLTLDPLNSSILYAVTEGGVYRSADAGVSWAWVTSVGGCCTGLVVVDPARPEVVYAGGPRALKWSEDRGRTWTTLLSAPPAQPTGAELLAVVPGNPSTVFISDAGKLLRSRDEGRTWEPVPFDREALRIVVHPRNPAVLYLVSFSGVAKSRDGGGTWTFLDLPLTPQSREDPRALALAPSAPETVYVVAGERIFRSRNGGRTWTAFVFPGGDSIAVDPRDPATVWATGLRGPWMSRDAGKTWKPSPRGLPAGHHLTSGVRSLVIDPANPDVLYVGFSLLQAGDERGGGVAKSINGGRRWWAVPEKGLSAADFGFVRFDPWMPNSVYTALVSMNGDFPCFWQTVRSLDGGRRWEPFAEDLGDLGDLAFDPEAPGVVIAAGEEGVWRSENSGTSWRRVAAEPAGLLAVPAPGTILAAGSCGLRRSADRGRTWRQVLPCETNPPDAEYPAGVVVRELTVDPSNPGSVYAWVVRPDGPGGRYEWILRSDDAGATWTAVRDGGPLAIAPSDPRVLYLFDADPIELLRSDDRGETWSVVGPRELLIQDLAVAPWDPDTVYAAVARRGVLRSTDGGATWETLHNGLARMDRLDVRGVTLDPWHPGRLFTWGADKGGLFELRDPEAPGEN